MIQIINKDGVAIYHPGVLSIDTANQYLIELQKGISWEQDVIHLFGKTFITQRRVAWFGDAPYKYKYSKISRVAKPWTNVLKQIKEIVESNCDESFNSCLLNLYQDGNEGMGWHADNEKELKRNGTIASVSIGAERKFSFKHKVSHEVVDINLENGSALLMKGEIQQFWKHCLPKSKKISKPRVNLTFRNIEA
ncbi:MAG: alpha-ketoglutarate-dependent dioxygenase AlkB [Betaproteobacteria bacterium]